MSEEKQASQKRQARVRYEGRVQGVGFRYTTVSLASNFKVTGFVRNEPDGSVLLVAEGDESELVAFMKAVKNSYLGRYITAERVGWAAATGEFSGFGVRHAW